MARTYIISEICGDWALQIREPGHPHQFLYFNSENNADLVKSILEWEDEHPNEAVPYKPTLTPPNEWVSVEDRLPDELTMVLIYSGGIYDVAGWIEDEDGKICWTHNVKPQFWMPLPAPPDRRPPEGEV